MNFEELMKPYERGIDVCCANHPRVGTEHSFRIMSYN